MNYALGHSFNLKHIFEKFPVKKLKTHYKTSLLYTNSVDLKVLCAEIFSECVNMVIEDVIENDVTFKLPGVKADIHMYKLEEEEFIKARRRGKFRDIDFLATNFTAYKICLFLYGKIRTRVKNIYTDKNLKLKLTDMTNSGHSYA